MESIIKWHTGIPTKRGRYILSIKGSKKIDTDNWSIHTKNWYHYNNDYVLAWCRLNDIEPYKEETMDKVNKAIFDSNAQCCDISNRLIKEETMEERKYADLRLDVDQDDKLATEATIDGNKITPPYNYLIGKITKVDNGMLVEFVKKQPQYPKTYEKCCQVLLLNKPNYTTGYREVLLTAFHQLLVCRDAYWKIAGEQMGLGRPWKPESIEMSHAIVCRDDGDFLLHRRTRAILIFPTKEMRDAFYENFKGLIEFCKEIL